MKLHFPQGIDEARFLREYWQRKPLLMRGALATYAFPLSAEELAGLACEEELESRLVMSHGHHRWELRHGPFEERLFAQLPEKNWTLLVQDVDKYLPEVARLLEPFRFIPSWRFDDVMISYAAPGGSVGPHIDTYDVFLVQGMGRRRWQLQTRPQGEALLPDLPVRILARFEAEQEWLLEQGDVLYLPPGVAHWGIAEGPCMTWSVGLRAPSLQEMLDSFAGFLVERLPPTEHYRDPPLDPAAPPAFVPPEAGQSTFAELDRWLLDPGLRRQWFGSFMTETKNHLAIEPPQTQVTVGSLLAYLANGGSLRRHPFARFAWSFGDDGGLLLFVSGEIHTLPPLPEKLPETLCSGQRLDRESLAEGLENRAFTRLLTELVNLGQLETEDA